MELHVIRRVKRSYTSGELHINDQFFCYTLEDQERDGDIFQVKVPGATCIPKGRYKVIINYSNRFKQNMPLLLSVPNFEGVRIHTGNKKENTEGCILVGDESGDDGFLGSSRTAYNRLMEILEEAVTKEKVYITIS